MHPLDDGLGDGRSTLDRTDAGDGFEQARQRLVALRLKGSGGEGRGMLDSVDAFTLTADGHALDVFFGFRLYIYGERRAGLRGREMTVSYGLVASAQQSEADLFGSVGWQWQRAGAILVGDPVGASSQVDGDRRYWALR